MARGSFWDELGRDRERRRRAEVARLRAEAQIRKDGRRDTVGTQRETAAAVRAAGEAEAKRRQAELEARINELTGLLRKVVNFPVPTITELRDHPPVPQPDPSSEEPPRWTDFAPSEPGLLRRLGYARAEAAARARFDAAFAEFARRRSDAADRHQALVEKVRDEHERRIDELVAAAYRGVDDAPAQLAAAVLESTSPLRPLIEGGRGVYRPEARELGVEIELPAKATIPIEGRWKWAVKDRAVVADPRRDSAARYRALIAAVSLAALSACFRAFPPEIVDIVTINGRLTATDPATGQADRHHLVSVSVDRSAYLGLQLKDPEFDVERCLRETLCAELSDNPYALENVTPLLDIDLASRYRLITSPEELAVLDHRADLMRMDPYQFEGLIAALFRAKGYEAWRTQSSRDDGIDAVASKRDAHVPVECLIQVKRTRNVVPPKEIQALMGALAEHPTATNGLLVTTSWFSDRSRRRGQDRRIGTMEGGELREQIKKHLGRDVVISAKPPPRRV